MLTTRQLLRGIMRYSLLLLQSYGKKPTKCYSLLRLFLLQFSLRLRVNTKPFIFVLVAIFLLPVPSSFVCAKPQATRPVILEIKWEQIGLGGTEGEHTYCRIYSDGSIEYEDRVVKGTPPKHTISFPLIKSKLTEKRMQTIKNLITSADIKQLEAKYDPPDWGIDSAMILTLTIFNNAQAVKSTELTNFNPTHKKASAFYPPALLKIMCEVERLRGRSTFKVPQNVKPRCPR